jgi:hypothetical protein
MYTVQKRDQGTVIWVQHTICGSETNATIQMDALKRKYPTTQVRVVDSEGHICIVA